MNPRMKINLHISKRFISEILEKSKSFQEICGILVGIEDKPNFKVKEVHFTENILSSPIRFQIDAKEFIKIYEESVKKGLDVIGFFHSHPSSPHPSTIDKDYMMLWQDKVWLIISSIDLSYNAFVVTGDKINKINIIEVKS